MKHTGKRTPAVKPGDLIRVRVLGHVRKNSYLVEFKGEVRTAVLQGRIPRSLFLARVVKLSPRMVLQHVSTFGDKEQDAPRAAYRTLLGRKKSFIQKLIATDNFLGTLEVHAGKKGEQITESLRDAVRNHNIYRLLQKGGIVPKEIVTYYCLQQMHNLLNYGAAALLFSLKVRDRSYPCDLAVSRAEDGSESSFLLTISLENGNKIVFLVFTDYKVIHCNISTNSEECEKKMRAEADALIGSLKRIRFDREITVRFSRYEESGFSGPDNLKKIDIRL